MNCIFAPQIILEMIAVMNQPRFSIDEWRRILQRQRASGLTAAAFCGQARIPVSSFFFWRRKLHREAPFAEVQVVPPTADRRADARVADQASRGASPLEVRLAGGRSVVVRPGFCRRTLLELLAALEAGVPDTRPEAAR